MSRKLLLLTVLALGFAGCDDRQPTKSTIRGAASDGPMTGGSVPSAPPATAPATQPTQKQLDPQAIPADRAGLRDHASDAKK